MLRAEAITKKYRTPDNGKTYFNAVSDVSLQLPGDSIVVLVGESGSGKSTLARILAYIERPDTGQVFLDSLEVSGCKQKALRAVRGKVQFVMQNAVDSLDPHQTIAGILDEPLRLLLNLGAADRKRRIAELMDMVRLTNDVLGRRPNELSGGQQKRVCIARALATEPQHIIFDESFSGLDVTLKQQVLELLLKLQRELKLSFLIITHDLDTAMYMADVIHVMRCGKIIETLTAPRCFADFKNPYSQELVQAVLSKRQALQ